MLDGLRGIAALMVLVYHVSLENGLNYLPGAWAAVDLFFLLSGFVIMHSYAAKINQGMTLAHFLKVRLIRLLPLYFIGLMLGMSAAFAGLLNNDSDHLTAGGIVQSSVLGVFMIPYGRYTAWMGLSHVGGDNVFPLDPPAWSLFFELLVNVIFFAWIARFKTIRLPFVLAAVAIFLLARFHSGYAHPGWTAHNFIYGLPRVTAEFFLGTLIYMHHARLSPHLARLSLGLSAAAFGLFLTDNASLLLLDILLLTPLAITSNAAVRIAEFGKKACTTLGEISYPLYITHVPILETELRVFHIGRFPPAVQLAIVCVTATASALLLAKLDKVIRKRLMHTLLPAERKATIKQEGASAP